MITIFVFFQSGSSNLTYNIINDSESQFSIDNSGTISVYKNLDRERTEKHIIFVTATDNGSSASHTVTATVTVNILYDTLLKVFIIHCNFYDIL